MEEPSNAFGQGLYWSHVGSFAACSWCGGGASTEKPGWSFGSSRRETWRGMSQSVVPGSRTLFMKFRGKRGFKRVVPL